MVLRGERLRFYSTADGSKDVFVHFRAIQVKGYESLNEARKSGMSRREAEGASSQ